MLQTLPDLPESAAVAAETQPSRLRSQPWVPFALGAVVFAIDVLVGRGIDVGMLYVLAVLAALWARPPRAALYVAAALTPLLVLGHALAPAGGTPAAVALVNRGLALLMIWGAAALLVHRAREIEAARGRVAGLQESEASLRAMFEVTSVGMAQSACQQRRFLHVNAAFCGLTGYTERELIGRSVDDLNHPDDRERDREAFARLLRGESREYRVEKRYVRKDGEVIWVEATANLVRDADGRPLRTVAIIQDITERRRIEAQLRAGQSELELVIDAIPVLISYIDAQQRYRFNNRTYELWFGHQRAEIRGRHMREILGEAAYERLRPAVERALAGEMVHFETELDYLNAGRREVSITYVPHWFGGRVAGFIVLVEDIAERRRTERARAHMAAIVESSSDAILSKTLEGILTSWNAGAERLFGYTADEMVGTSIMRLVPPELRDEEESILARLARGERISALETERLRKSGERVMVSLTVSPVRDAAANVIGASTIARDITERKRAEAHRELLVRELIHRVKNTLAVVQSIARQTGRGAGSIEEFSRGFDSRLAALARAHDLLLVERWQPVELQRLIRQVLRPHLSETGSRIEVSGPAVLIEAAAAISLSMALHELATNAVKYGALSHSEGRVSVLWQRSTQVAPAVELQWRERGGPPVVPPVRTGFGSRLVQGLAREFGAEIKLDFAPEGVECRMHVPLADVQVSSRIEVL